MRSAPRYMARTGSRRTWQRGGQPCSRSTTSTGPTGASLRWLAYLVARLEGLPVLAVAAVRSGETGAPSASISAIVRAGRILRPSPLSRDATGTLVRDALGEDASADVCEACHPATGGNPFLVRCLLEALRDVRGVPGAPAAEAVTETHSDAISRATAARLARLPPVARDLASAVAVFGVPCSLGDAAAIAGLDEDAAVAAADALAAHHLIAASEPLEFLHPIVRTAVLGEIPSHRRARWHRRAARLLDDAEAPSDQIAVHLLAVAPSGDATVVGILRSAATVALAAGAPESAVEYLGRALVEPPPGHVRVAILRELGAAEASLHSPAAAEHLQAAFASSSEPRERAEIATASGDGPSASVWRCPPSPSNPSRSPAPPRSRSSVRSERSATDGCWWRPA
jgi:hypothetical protein